MHVQLRLDGRHPRRWHSDLLRDLSALPGFDISVDASLGPEPWPAGASLLFDFETLLNGIAAKHSAVVPLTNMAPFQNAPTGTPDLILDLCGDVQADAGARVWQLQFSGTPGESALLGCLLDGNFPLVAIMEKNRTIHAGRPGSERGDVILISFDDVLGRARSLILTAIAFEGSGVDRPMPTANDALVQSALLPLRLARAGGRELARKLARYLYRMCFRTPQWRTGWRTLNGPDLYDLRAHPDGGWHDIPDDGSRFYADPFAIEHQGKVFLFVEDFPHKTQKGLISAVEMGPQGPIGAPQPVLEAGCHLSYPFVFEADGQMWMIPETSGARTIELYRATQFPAGWVRESILVSDLVAGDATLCQHDGLWWMFATVQDDGGAFSDALYLWSASDFRGPWTQHPRNPVLVDIASARPAGQIVNRGGQMLRPVQDSRKGYGTALGIARITQLDHEGYAQVVETQIVPGSKWPGRRLHTLNSAGGFEFIDGEGRARRW